MRFKREKNNYYFLEFIYKRRVLRCFCVVDQLSLIRILLSQRQRLTYVLHVSSSEKKKEFFNISLRLSGGTCIKLNVSGLITENQVLPQKE